MDRERDGSETDGHRVEAGERMGDEKWRMERGERCCLLTD